MEQSSIPMRIGILKETVTGERRVALVPESVGRLAQQQLQLLVQTGAGESAFFTDEEYRAAGARICGSAAELLAEAELIVQVQKPTPGQVEQCREGAVSISLLFPLLHPDLVLAMAKRRLTAVALDQIPRTTQAQAMDILSSQASIAGYWSVLAAAHRLPRYFPMLMTAAGTIPPARVLVLGAGVAGLQAIATAKRLGAAVEAFDVRRAARQEVESLGARFIEVSQEADFAGEGGYARETTAEYQQRQTELIKQHLAKSDVAITTALIPGRRAPILIAADMVPGMRPGSVIVDLGAEQGGNCELTEPGQEVVRHGVTIVGPLNAPSALAVHASQLFSRNVEKLLQLLVRDGALNLDFANAIVQGCVVAHAGSILHPRLKEMVHAD